LKPKLILLTLACAFFLGFAVSPVKANTRVLSAPRHSIFLVLKEESGVVTQAILRTPGTLQPVTEIVGLSFAGENTSTLTVDRDAKPDLLWKLTFLDQKDRSQGTVLWISALTRQPRVWLAVSPVAETRLGRYPTEIDGASRDTPLCFTDPPVLLQLAAVPGEGRPHLRLLPNDRSDRSWDRRGPGGLQATSPYRSNRKGK